MKSAVIIKVNDLPLCESFYRDVLQLGQCEMSSSFGSFYSIAPDTGVYLLKTNARFLEHGSSAVCWSFTTPDMAALEHRLPTIAVMATGPESVYPHRHRETAERIASTPGCALITDYPPGTAPLAIHFLRRNRIIAGLSKATVLVESKIRGGGMMTCRLAFSYDRDVYALPGRADDIRSQGCNELIRKKIAEPITSASSLIEELGMKSVAQSLQISDTERLESAYSGRMCDEDIRLMARMLAAIRGRRSITVEEICTVLDTGYRKAAELTGILEIDGFITTDLLQRCSINPKIM